MITTKMLKTAVDGLTENLVSDDKASRRKCPNLHQILHTISLVLGMLMQINDQIQQLEKFRESYENQKRFVKNNCESSVDQCDYSTKN